MRYEGIILALGFALSCSAAFARDDSKDQLKSVGIAVVLGLDPIPADSLFYAGKNQQAKKNLVLGLAGACLAGGGLIDLVYAESGLTPHNLEGFGMFFAGSALYAASLLWDLIGGVEGVNEHNNQARAKKHYSMWQNAQPSLAVTNEGVMGLVQLRF